MTRFVWTCIALFPVPLIVMLILGPPEAFDDCTLVTDCETYSRH